VNEHTLQDPWISPFRRLECISVYCFLSELLRSADTFYDLLYYVHTYSLSLYLIDHIHRQLAIMNGRKPWIANLDMYRKVPGDLMEQSPQGSIVSVLAMLSMTVLFFRETQQYLTPHLITDLALDKTESQLSKIRADFNITLADVKCQVSDVMFCYCMLTEIGCEQTSTYN
jgi:hypothetical protein